jgi:vesicle coat complex subunit
LIISSDHWLRETDYQSIEGQLLLHSTTDSGALEHDETYLYRRDRSSTSFNIINHLFHSSSPTDTNSPNAYYSPPTELNIPEPLPLGTAIIDASIRLYSNMFIHVSNKHRLNMFQYFIDLIKQSKDARQEAIEINILTAVLLSLKTLAKTKQYALIDDDNLKKCACTLILQTLSHSNPILRCVGGEALGYLTEVVDDRHFVGNMMQFCFDHLKESRDIQSRTGYSFALGCLYRSMNSMSKGQYLNFFVPTLLSLMQDQSVTIVQVWALHALTLIADSSGEMFRSYFEPLLELILHLLLSTPSSQIDIYQCCGRLLSILIINMGPDLQTNTNYISTVRSSCLTASHLLQMHIEPVVQAEAVQALQQVHFFAPRHINLSVLVPELIKELKSRDLLLRRACISFLKQLVQREAKEVNEHAKLLFMHVTAEDLSTEFSIFGSLEG